METINDVFSPELLDKVFAYLSLSDQANAIQVCRLWHDVVCARLNVMEYLELSDASKEDVVKQLVRLEGSNVFRGLRDIYLELRPRYNHDGMMRLLDSIISGGGLTKLRIYVAAISWIDSINCLLTKRISVHNFSPDAQLLCLEHLQITSKCHTCEHFCMPLVELVSVVLKNVPTNLKVIVFRHVHIGSKVVELVGSSPKLHTLVLQRIVDRTGLQKITAIIANLSNLEVLDLRGSDVVMTSEFVNAINGLTRLTFIGMSYNITATSTDFSNLAKTWSKLKSIVTEKYRVFSVDSICIIKYFTFINVLEVCLQTEQQLRTLSNTVASCKVQVSQLDVSRSTHVITDEFLRSLVVACGEAGCLRSVDANGCRRLTNQGVANVISSYKCSTNSSCVEEQFLKHPPSADTLSVEGIHGLNHTLFILLNDMPGPPRTKRLNVFASNTKLREQLKHFPDNRKDCGINGMISLLGTLSLRVWVARHWA